MFRKNKSRIPSTNCGTDVLLCDFQCVDATSLTFFDVEEK